MTDPIGFLIADTARMMRRRFDERARAIGVTRPQWRTLVTLAREEGIQQSALADRLEVEPITLCRMIDRLAEADLVERRRDPADRRAWRIFLTDRARPLLDRIGIVADDLFAVALDGIDEAERSALTATLEHIRANLSTDASTRETAHG
jgi:DNA-binding MarR family transcriptional regulator